MKRGDSEWLANGFGNRPRLAWSFATEAPLVDLRCGRETGEIVAADAVGGLYRLDRDGELVNVTHGPAPIRSVAWSDTGAGGLALVGEDKLYWFDRQLTFQGWNEHTEEALAVAIEPHGHYAAISFVTGVTIIYNSNRKLIRRIGTKQPLVAIEFLASRPALVGVAEYGMLCCNSFAGAEEWKEQLFSNVGDMSITGDGRTILLACFSHGIQCHDGHGRQIGSYQLEGTVFRVATSFAPGKIAAATQERHFHFIDADGQVIFQAELPDDVAQLHCDPFGKSVIVGFQSGRIARLDW